MMPCSIEQRRHPPCGTVRWRAWMLTATYHGTAGLGVNDGASQRSRVNWPMLSSWLPLILIQNLLCWACATAEGTAAYTQQHILKGPWRRRKGLPGSSCLIFGLACKVSHSPMADYNYTENNSWYVDCFLWWHFSFWQTSRWDFILLKSYGLQH